MVETGQYDSILKQVIREKPLYTCLIDQGGYNSLGYKTVFTAFLLMLVGALLAIGYCILEHLALILRFSVNLGLALINSVPLLFEIPKDNGVLPFHWHHICISSSEDSYSIVLDGQQWYHANHEQKSFEKTTVTRLDLGTTNKYWTYTDGINFRGLLSELNIWSKTLSVSQIVKITTNCGKVDPVPDLLNWSELSNSMIRGSKYNEDIGVICPQRNTTSPIYKIMPYLHDQVTALHVCKILNGKLAFPNSLNEFKKWKGRLLRMMCINANND